MIVRHLSFQWRAPKFPALKSRGAIATRATLVAKCFRST